MTNSISNQLEKLGINSNGSIYFQIPVAELVEHALTNHEATLTDSGALSFNTGKFTGRSPGSRFLVKDSSTLSDVDWGAINKPMTSALFDELSDRAKSFLSSIPIYVRLSHVCNHPDYKQNILSICESPCQDLFVNNMFTPPVSLDHESIDWNILVASSLKIDDYETLGLPSSHCVSIDLTRRKILIIGTAYTGEIKKSIFSALNYTLPLNNNILTMHCAANVGPKNDTALFFGLSGTGKTTLSSDHGRILIGDDEHGWDQNSIFNFEGGCYAKTIGLTFKNEPHIFNAIRFGALLENVSFKPNSREVDYENAAITENMRTSYPINFIQNVTSTGRGETPEHIFFLSADAFGVLPPISKLNLEQAIYYFINGYTAKVAGTEIGIKSPVATFSACFGAAFMPLHPMKYADMLRQKLKDNPKIKVWLVNTGWIAGPYGIGRRIPLGYTRELIRSAIANTLDEHGFQTHQVFGFQVPRECPDIPTKILNPKLMWENMDAYDEQAQKLRDMFDENYRQFAAFVENK